MNRGCAQFTGTFSYVLNHGFWSRIFVELHNVGSFCYSLFGPHQLIFLHDLIMLLPVRIMSKCQFNAQTVLSWVDI